ncbi:MAG: hypothetical protein M0R73_12505 [Dehalococcoidia bacterium]|nr:hypothetical protein [Dehalococcoidia bacterium]
MASETRGIGEVVGELGVGERLVLAGAAGVFLLWLVFDLILQDYFVGQLPFLLAVLVLLAAVRVRVQNAEPIFSYEGALLVCALSLGVLGVLSVVEDVRYEVLSRGGATAVGAVLFWLVALVAGAGAWRLLQERPSSNSTH